MSNEAVNWARSVQVYRDKPVFRKNGEILRTLTSSEQFVLWVIADRYSNKNKYAGMGRASIARDTKLDVSTISRCIQSLKGIYSMENGRPILFVQTWINNSTGENLNNRYFLPAFDELSGLNQSNVIYAEWGYDRDEQKVILMGEE